LPLTRSLRYGERIFGVELVIRRPSGKEIVALVNSAPVRNPQGRIISAVASVDDATELITLRRELERSLERERNFSILLQRALMPQELLQQKGYSVAVEYTPAFAEREIGGDFYDVFQTKNGSLALLIGDVSGKGLEAASTAAATRNTVRSFAYEYSSASEALSYANQVLFAQMPDYGYFVTVFLVIVDLSTGRIQYASAGHPPAAICHLDGTVEWVTVINLPVGPLDQVNYQEMPGELQVGEKLVLYTDGILEARHEHEMFELEGIERTLKENYTCTPKELASNLIKAATEWADGKLSDDVAILIFERNNPDNV
jgi:serine phosphatase RsbU (regulator of sigma subunit)